VDEFDQQGSQPSPEAKQKPDEETSGDDAQTSGKGTMGLMEQ